MPPATLAMFLHHPLFVTLQLEPDLAWRCSADVPDRGEYRLVAPEETCIGTMALPALATLLSNTPPNMLCWLMRRGITVHASQCGLLDIRNKSLHKVDMVAECCGRLTLILVYFSLRRGGEPWARMVEYGATVREVLADQYKLDGDVIVMNFYAEGRVHGAIIQA